MIKMLRTITVLAAMTAGSIAHATVTSYATWGAYSAATSGNTTINFNAQQTNASGVSHYGSSLTVGGVSFTDNQPRLFVLRQDIYNTPFTSAYLHNNGTGTQINVNFVNPVYGFAMDFGSILNFGGGTQQMTFNFAGSSNTFNLPGYLAVSGAPISFIGFTSDTAFSSISIGDPTRGLAIDNFTFASSATNVPEPGALALLGLGLAGLACNRKRKRK